MPSGSSKLHIKLCFTEELLSKYENEKYPNMRKNFFSIHPIIKNFEHQNFVKFVCDYSSPGFLKLIMAT